MGRELSHQFYGSEKNLSSGPALGEHHISVFWLYTYHFTIYLLGLICIDGVAGLDVRGCIVLRNAILCKLAPERLCKFFP